LRSTPPTPANASANIQMGNRIVDLDDNGTVAKRQVFIKTLFDKEMELVLEQIKSATSC
jgi:hypothetical protein